MMRVIRAAIGMKMMNDERTPSVDVHSIVCGVDVRLCRPNLKIEIGATGSTVYTM
jgi:hypothetical protein